MILVSNKISFYVKDILNLSFIINNYYKNHKKITNISSILKNSLKEALVFNQNSELIDLEQNITDPIYFECDTSEIFQIFINFINIPFLLNKPLTVNLLLLQDQNFITFSIGFNGYYENLQYLHQSNIKGLTTEIKDNSQFLELFLCKKLIDKYHGSLFTKSTQHYTAIKIQMKNYYE